jgi:hypothetical protein
MKEPVDIKDFARRVERLCDFFLDKLEEKDGSDNLKVIQDLKDEAADIQFDKVDTGIFDGLYDYMKGANPQ